MKKIAVFGSTGMIGKPVTKELLKNGYFVKSLVRSSSKAQKIGFKGSIEFIEGDVSNTSDVGRTIEGVDIVYISLSVDMNSKESDFQPEREGIELIIDVAKKKQVKCVAYLSGLLTNYFEQPSSKPWWVYNNIRNANVKKIKTSGLPYIIFKPSFFMDNFTGGLKQGNKVALAGTSKYPMYMVSSSDYARVVSKAFEQFDGTSKIYTIQGPEALTVDDGAKIFVENYDKEKLKVMKAPIGAMKFFGLFSRKMQFISNISNAINNYDEKFQSNAEWETFGKPQVFIKDFARS